MEPFSELYMTWPLPIGRLGRLEVDSACAQDLRRAQGHHYADRMNLADRNLVAPLSPSVLRLKAGDFHHPRRGH